MIAGVNFINLNAKNKKFQLRINNLSPNKKAKVMKLHINYIGRIKGAMNNGEHSLFGKLNNEDISYKDKKEILDYIDEKAKTQFFNKAVISIKEAEAEKYGMINKEEWINLINLKIKDIAKEYGIREDQVDYLASVHTEPGHIHCHLVFFDRNNKEQSNNFIKYDRIKRELNKYVYKEEISKIQEVQNKSKDSKLLKENFNKDMETLIGRSTLKMFNNRINIKELNNIQKEILSFYEKLKDYQEKNNKNSFRKAFLPPLLKDELRKLSFLIVGSSTQLSKNVKDYINSSIKQEVILSNNEKRLLITKEKAIEFIYSKVDNQILQFLKERKVEVNEYNKEVTNRLNQNKYKSSIKNNIAYNLNDLLNNINNTLEDTKEAQKGFSKQINKQNIETKAQRMEYYLKHRDVGLINWEN
ncbi:MAG: hypothetical protein HXK68_04010 [Clostridiales bacterium]|nr:hypothetical protein [Clostridiales bacterium]